LASACAHANACFEADLHEKNMDQIKPQNLLLASLVALLSYLCVALMGAAVKLMPSTVHTGVMIFFQYVIALILCVPLALKQGLANLKTQKFPAHVLRDLAGVVTFGLFFLSLAYISLTNSIVLRSTTPFWIPLILLVWRRDRVSMVLWISIIIGFIGVVFIVQPGTHGYFNLGSLLALASGFVMGISALTIRRLGKTEPPQRTLFYYFLIATIVSIPFAIYSWSPLNLHAWILLIIIGILMYVIQYTLIIAFSYAKASKLSPISYSAIVFSGLLDWLVWHQVPNLYGYIGIVLVIAAGMVTIFFEKQT